MKRQIHQIRIHETVPLTFFLSTGQPFLPTSGVLLYLFGNVQGYLSDICLLILLTSPQTVKIKMVGGTVKVINNEARRPSHHVAKCKKAADVAVIS